MPVAFKVRRHMTVSINWLILSFGDSAGLVFPLVCAVYRLIKGPRLYVLATLFDHQTHNALFRLVKINSPSLICTPQDGAVAVEAAASFVQ